MIDEDNIKAEAITIYLKWSALLKANKEFYKKNRAFFGVSMEEITVNSPDAPEMIKNIVDFILAGEQSQRIMALNTALFSISEFCSSARAFDAFEGKKKYRSQFGLDEVMDEARRVLREIDQNDINKTLDSHLLNSSSRLPARPAIPESRDVSEVSFSGFKKKL